MTFGEHCNWSYLDGLKKYAIKNIETQENIVQQQKLISYYLSLKLIFLSRKCGTTTELFGFLSSKLINLFYTTEISSQLSFVENPALKTLSSVYANMPFLS